MNQTVNIANARREMEQSTFDNPEEAFAVIDNEIARLTKATINIQNRVQSDNVESISKADYEVIDPEGNGKGLP